MSDPVEVLARALPEVDGQVISAACDLADAGKTNPAWAFIDYEAGKMSFGRWAKCGPNPAPYVRLDLILALIDHPAPDPVAKAPPEFWSCKDCGAKQPWTVARCDCRG